MKRYIGTKIIEAEPMNLGDYNVYKGWTIPEGEDPHRTGYVIFKHAPARGTLLRPPHPDGHVSWSPTETFEETYWPTEGMTFGLALDAIARGKRVARGGWRSDSMYIYLVHGSMALVDGTPLEYHYVEGTQVEYQSRIDIRCPDGTIAVWGCSQTDMLALDWMILDGG